MAGGGWVGVLQKHPWATPALPYPEELPWWALAKARVLSTHKAAL